MKRLFFLVLVLGLMTSLLQAQGASKGRRSSKRDSSSQQVEVTAEPGNAPVNVGTEVALSSPDASAQGAQASSVAQANGAKQPAASKQSFYAPKVRRDPTLSPDDMLILAEQERQRQLAAARERKRLEDEARKKAEQEEKERQWRLRLLKEPELEVKSKVFITSVIGDEVFFDRELKRPYTKGSTFPVKGLSGEMRRVKIEDINIDTVVFSYQGRRFSKKI